MTVAELRKMLDKYDDDTEVVIVKNSEYGVDYQLAYGIHDTEGYVFDDLWFLTSPNPNHVLKNKKKAVFLTP